MFLKFLLSEHEMTQRRSRRDGNRPFFREGLSVPSQFDELFFFSVDQLGTEISALPPFGLQRSDFRPGKAKQHGQTPGVFGFILSAILRCYNMARVRVHDMAIGVKLNIFNL